jgi:two-component system sensor histidine kinase MprB
MVSLTAAAVAAAVLLSAFACYLAVQSSLRGRLNHQLQTTATSLAAAAGANPNKGPGLPPLSTAGPTASIVRHIPGPSLQRTGEVAIFSADGTIYRSPQDHTRFRLSGRDLAVARGTSHAYFRDATISGTPVRAYVTPAGARRAVIAVQSLTELNGTLHKLAVILGAIGLAGVLLAGMLGLLVARAAARPVHALRKAAEHVGSTGDLSRRIQAVGRDDLGRLGESFNAMLAALARSQRTQRQLIGDASHELRTPIASLRMNLEVLARNPDLDLSERTPLLADLIQQSGELGALVSDLLETAREDEEDRPPESFRLDEIVASEVERWRTDHTEVQIDCRLEPCEIVGNAELVRRAVGNILDNAIKWSPEQGVIGVELVEGQLSVRDEGPGFSEADLPQVFERFYRSPEARAVAGSGLGLSIVRKVADMYGGIAQASNAPGGGALVVLRFVRD